MTTPELGDRGELAQQAPAAVAERISKSFGSTRALDDVSIEIRPGQCHALVGRNGAGKSTLVSILTGLERPDQGQVLLYGQPAPSPGDRAAWQHQVACVYQHSKVIPGLSVAENIFLNRFDKQLISWRTVRREAQRVMKEWGLELDADVLASDLSVEQRQMVEIARALSIGARFLILDEPTASLEARATERLFGHVRRLVSTGVGVLYISHHLDEIDKICDHVTVLRDGKRVLVGAVEDLDQAMIVNAMVGGAVAPIVGAGVTATDDAPVRLRIEELTVRSPSGPVYGASLSIRAGECLGLVGLRGSGSSTVADVVAGLIQPDGGRIQINDADPRPSRNDSSVRRGIGYVPEDRHARGFIRLLGVDENLTLPILRSLSRVGFVSGSRRARAASDLRSQLEVVARNGKQPVGELSGGNQQKVVVGRALASDPSVLVIVSPTVGVDVASKAALLGVVDQARREGVAVLLVSDDLDELRIATRLVVMVRGRIVHEFKQRPWNDAEVIAAAEGLVA